MKQSLQKPQQITLLWLGPLLFMAVVGLYMLVRSDGNWAETDSATFTRYIRDFVSHGKILPQPEGLYPHGYAYQAVSTFILALTGLKVETLQQWIYPLLAWMVVLPAWITYRELTTSALGATLTTLLLFTQPEFLFVILRSSHEKLTRTLMLICLFLLFRSISQAHSHPKQVLYISVFYFMMYGLISSNLLFANSLILAITIVYFLGLLTEIRNPKLKAWNRPLESRLRYAIPICIGLVYIFITYIYPPARHNFGVFQNTWDLIKTLFVESPGQSTDLYVAYDYAVFGWINLPTYFILSIANWIMLVTSFAIWLHQGWSWFWHSNMPKNQITWFLWLLYAAFAIQEALAVISDASGALSSNLQLRLFPSFTMIAIAIIGAKLAEWRPLHHTRTISLGLTSLLFGISILSVLKATNEPLLSNKWSFYDSNELLALKWGDAHLNNAGIWTEFDERLTTAYITEIGDPSNRFTSTITSNTRDMLLSTITSLRSSRTRQPLPIPPDAFQVYDNGTAQIFHLRPRTPYQP